MSLLIKRAEPRSEEWHNLRRGGIGGSDFSNLLETEYACPRKLWYEKTGQPQDFDDSNNPAFRRGRRQEPVAIQYFIEQEGVEVTTNLPTYFTTKEFGQENGYSFDTSIARCNPDGIYFKNDEQFILEVKTVGKDRYESIRKHGIPEHYIAQAVWTAGILRACSWCFVVFSPELDGLLSFTAKFDTILFNSLGVTASRFWHDHINPGLCGAPERISEDRVCRRCPYRKTCKALTKSGIDKLSF